MPKYIVCVYQETYTDFEVEAGNEETAMEKVMTGEGEEINKVSKGSEIVKVDLKESE